MCTHFEEFSLDNHVKLYTLFITYEVFVKHMNVKVFNLAFYNMLTTSFSGIVFTEMSTNTRKNTHTHTPARARTHTHHQQQHIPHEK